MADPPVIEIREWGRRARRVTLGGPLLMGRECEGENLADEEVSASTCGWCHNDGGRSPGKGPQLMNTQRSDDFIRNRIKTGKEGAMPAFGKTFSDTDIDQIIAYIRALKPQ